MFFFHFFFFFNDTATTEIYTLSLHDALPIWRTRRILLSDTLLADHGDEEIEVILAHELAHHVHQDRKSTRLNSSHSQISYAVFCLKKKNKKQHYIQHSTQ